MGYDSNNQVLLDYERAGDTMFFCYKTTNLPPNSYWLFSNKQRDPVAIILLSNRILEAVMIKFSKLTTAPFHN